MKVLKNLQFVESPEEKGMIDAGFLGEFIDRHIIGTTGSMRLGDLLFFVEKSLGYECSEDLLKVVLEEKGYLPFKDGDSLDGCLYHMRFTNIYQLTRSENIDADTIFVDTDGRSILITELVGGRENC